MIQHLQNRFGLSKVQASVIFFKLQEHFTKNYDDNQQVLPESFEGS
jgi:ribosomal protein S17E